MSTTSIFEDFFNTSRDLFCVVGEHGHISHTNVSAVRMVGYLPKELVGMAYMDFVHPDDVASTEKALSALMKGVAISFENRFRSKDGTYRFVSWSGTRKQEHVYLSGRDVTSVKYDQERLETAERRLRLLYEASSNPRHTLWEQIEHVLELGNKELQTHSALIGEIAGDNITVIRMKSNARMSFAEGDRVPLAETFSRYVLEAGKPFAIEVTADSVYDTHPAHTKLGLETYIGAPLWVQGSVYGTLNFSSTTPRKKPFETADLDFVLLMGQWIGSTMALIFAQENVAYVAAIVESSDDAIIGQSLDGTITSWNRGAHTLFGYTDSETIGKHISVIVPKDLVHELGNIQEKLLKRESVSHFDTLRKRKDNTTFDASINMSPIINEEGGVIGISSVIRDVTKEKEVDRAKTEFVSLASHQLRTPLSAVNWYAELIESDTAGSLSKAQSEYLDEIMKAQKRMTSLINNLLNVSRIELGTFTIDPTNVDVVALVRSILKDLQRLIGVKKLHVKQIYAEKRLELHLDEGLMRMVLFNVLSNAVKYTPENGTIALTIAVEKEKNRVCIEISDTGYGIPKNQQHQIFKKLFRADNVIKRETDGTGLGLYIAKSILEASGGSISFDSVENKGSSFHITLPFSGMKAREGSRVLGL